MDEKITDKTPDQMTEEERHLYFVNAITESINGFPNAPTAEQIAAWKTEFKSIFASGVSDDEVFIFRPIKRAEFNDAKASAANEDEYMKVVVAKVVLWMSSPESLEEKAGTLEVIIEQIMTNSNFLAPEVAKRLVIKL
jgi:hypothetical protein